MTADQEPFRWRTSPHVIGQYVLDRNVPKNARITLKPNEACVVVEKGRIVGTATQTNMEVNPQAGLISRIFGKGTPDRAFLFVFLGPHEILLRVSGRTSDGHQIHGAMGIRVEFTIQELGRLLRLPARGEPTIGVGDIAKMIEHEVSTQVSTEIIATATLEELRSSVDLREDAEAGVRVALRSTFESLALNMKGAWVSWNPTEHEKLLSMQDELSEMKQRNEVIDGKAVEEMEAMLRNRSREHELLHRMHVQNLNVQAQQQIAGEVAQLQAQISLDDARWQVLAAQEHRQQAHVHAMESADRNAALEAANHGVEMAHAEAERARILNEQVVEAERSKQQVTIEGESAKMDIAMDAFAKVQEAKRQRIELQASQEQQRHEHLQNMKQDEQGMVERLLSKGLESGATDSAVLQEMLRSQATSKEHEAGMTSSSFIDADSKQPPTPSGNGQCQGCQATIQPNWAACPYCGHKVA